MQDTVRAFTKASLTATIAAAKERTGKRRLERTVAEAWAVAKPRIEHSAWLARLPSTIEGRRRGGETDIETENGTEYLRVTDRRDGLVLLGCDGWRYYSRQAGSRQGPWFGRLTQER